MRRAFGRTSLRSVLRHLIRSDLHFFRTKASLTCLENEYFALPLDRLRTGDFRFGEKF